MKKISLFLFVLIILSACAPTPTQTSEVSATPAPETLATTTPTPEPAATATEISSAVSTETAYFQTLTPEQKSMIDAAPNLTAEGWSRQVVLHDEYVVYAKDSAIGKAFVEGNIVPAAMFGENNLMIN